MMLSLRRFGLACLLLGLLGCSEDTTANATTTGAGGNPSGVGGHGGTTSSSGVGGSAGSPSVFTGDAVWSRRGDGLSAARSVAVDKDGYVIVAGVFQGTLDFGAGPIQSAGQNDIFVARFDPDGLCTWTKGFGGLFDDGANDVAVDANGNVLVSGAFQGMAQFDGQSLISVGSYDVYVAKLDSQGTNLWVRAFGTTSFDVSYGIDTGPTGDVVVMGTAPDTITFGGGPLGGSGTSFAVRLDSAGDYVSGRLFEPSSIDALSVDQGDHVVLGGSFSGTVDLGTGPLVSQASTDGFVARFDTGWNPIFAERIGEGSYMTVYSTATDAMGGVVTGGMAQSNGVTESFVAVDRFSPDGTLQWTKRLGAAEYAAANSVVVDNADNVVITGFVRDGTLDLGCGPMASPLDPDKPFAGDIFLAKLDAGGACIWSKIFGGPGNQFAIGVDVDAMDNILMTGEYQTAVDFGSGPLIAEHYPEACVAKFKP